MKKSLYSNSLLIILVIIFNFPPILSQGNEIIHKSIRDVTCSEAYDFIKQQSGDTNFVIIDFRPESMFIQSHLEGAIFHDVFSNDIDAWLGELDKTSTYLIYCTIGHRSGIALSKMKEAGTRRILHMHEGLGEWELSGYPTVSGH